MSFLTNKHNCPSCGARFEDDSTGHTSVKCNYCGFVMDIEDDVAEVGDSELEVIDEEFKGILFKVKIADTEKILNDWLVARGVKKAVSGQSNFIPLERHYFPLYLFKGSYKGSYDTYTDYMGGRGDLMTEGTELKGNFARISIFKRYRDNFDKAVKLGLFSNIDLSIFEPSNLRKIKSDIDEVELESIEDHWNTMGCYDFEDTLIADLRKELGNVRFDLDQIKYNISQSQIVCYPYWETAYKDHGQFIPIFIDGITGEVVSVDLKQIAADNKKKLKKRPDKVSFFSKIKPGIILWVSYWLIRVILKICGHSTFPPESNVNNIFFSMLFGYWWFIRGAIFLSIGYFIQYLIKKPNNINS